MVYFLKMVDNFNSAGDGKALSSVLYKISVDKNRLYLGFTNSLFQEKKPEEKPKNWMEVQHERQQRLREFCAKKNLKNLPQPKFAHNWIYSDNARVSYCSIPKVACTTWKKLFQVLCIIR